MFDSIYVQLPCTTTTTTTSTTTTATTTVFTNSKELYTVFSDSTEAAVAMSAKFKKMFKNCKKISKKDAKV